MRGSLGLSLGLLDTEFSGLDIAGKRGKAPLVFSGYIISPPYDTYSSPAR